MKPRERLHEVTGVRSQSCGWVEHAEYPQASITLVSVDNVQYSLDEWVTFEVKIQNTGAKSFDIPWFPEIADIEPQGTPMTYGFLEGTISLNFTHGKNVMSIFSRLYGSNLMPGSVLQLKPGEWVTVRSRSQFVLVDEWALKELRKFRFFDSQVDADLGLNNIRVLPKGPNGIPSEEGNCVNIQSRPANKLTLTLYARGGE
ncbi:MAG TPA: hypothetical protein VLK33_07040 [Terriglobales bacterium]|nr:hypothetical protein [Terriglobales bacterium]